MLSTAAAPLSVRRRPAAARLVPTSTGCSRGAEACRFGLFVPAAAPSLMFSAHAWRTRLLRQPAQRGDRSSQQSYIGRPGGRTPCGSIVVGEHSGF